MKLAFSLHGIWVPLRSISALHREPFDQPPGLHDIWLQIVFVRINHPTWILGKSFLPVTPYPRSSSSLFFRPRDPRLTSCFAGGLSSSELILREPDSETPIVPSCYRLRISCQRRIQGLPRG